MLPRNFTENKAEVDVEEVTLWSDLQVVQVAITNSKHLRNETVILAEDLLQ